jgi:predicted outer membrane repeat protein
MFPFVPISYLTPDSVGDKAAVWKNYSVKNGGSILADGDIVTVTVTIQARQSFV